MHKSIQTAMFNFYTRVLPRPAWTSAFLFFTSFQKSIHIPWRKLQSDLVFLFTLADHNSSNHTLSNMCNHIHTMSKIFLAAEYSVHWFKTWHCQNVSSSFLLLTFTYVLGGHSPPSSCIFSKFIPSFIACPCNFIGNILGCWTEMYQP